jgi:hypothetical protein
MDAGSIVIVPPQSQFQAITRDERYDQRFDPNWYVWIFRLRLLICYGATMHGEWIRRPKDAAASAVFVHGILSSGETCWRHDNGCCWPGLLKNEPELGSLGIYVFTYETGIFSGSYRLSDIVDALKEHMRLDGVLKSNRLVFVCHSMGGIVVRKYIVERAAELIGAEKKIDLFLVASPSLGASYADWLSPLAQLLGHAQAVLCGTITG